MKMPEIHIPCRLMVAGLLLLIAGCQAEPGVPIDERPAPLLLISIDGFRHDYFAMFDSPAMDRLMREGLYADSLHHVFPTKTFATHYTMVTGLHPGTHGIVANSMWDPERKASFSLGDREAVGDGYWYQGGEPIWVTAERQGLTAATFFWPGSEARIHRIRPSYWKPYDGSVTHEDRIEQVLEWLALPAEERPDFLTLYFSSVDSRGHGAGPGAPPTLAAAEDVDRHIGKLLDGLEAMDRLDRINIILVSDHGMSEVDPERYIMLDEYLDLGQVHVSDWGPAAQIWAGETSADEIVSALTDTHPHLRVWAREDIPPRYRFGTHHRVPDVLAEADPGWMISSKPFAADRNPPRGMHGWDPAYGEMHGILVARGPDFTPGSRSPAMRSVDLYALMTHLLGLEPAEHEGALTPFEPYLNAQQPPDYRQARFRCDTGPVEAHLGPAHMALYANGYIHVLDRSDEDQAHFGETGLSFRIRADGTASASVDGTGMGRCTALE